MSAHLYPMFADRLDSVHAILASDSTLYLTTLLFVEETIATNRSHTEGLPI